METKQRSSEVLGKLFTVMQSDTRLAAVHVSMCFVFFRYWLKEGRSSPIHITRRAVMNYSRIKSTATYHRCIHDLESWGYITYTPSFHPKGSEVYLHAAA